MTGPESAAPFGQLPRDDLTVRVFRALYTALRPAHRRRDVRRRPERYSVLRGAQPGRHRPSDQRPRAPGPGRPRIRHPGKPPLRVTRPICTPAKPKRGTDATAGPVPGPAARRRVRQPGSRRRRPDPGQLARHGITGIYTAAAEKFAVISATADLTVWTNGLLLWCTHKGQRHTWPAADTETAATRLAVLARPAAGS